jgi:diadenosine tetraphosphate (Ap4A) HIT family hydrolase
MKQPDFNIVSNQGYAQIVHHVHYHLVPAPMPGISPTTNSRSGWATILGRDELDEEEAEVIVKNVREALEVEGRERAKL